MIHIRNIFSAASLITLIGCTSPQEVRPDGELTGICPVHHLAMQKATVPLDHGYYVAPADGPRRQICSAWFPFAQWFLMSGEPISEGESPTTTKIYHCLECERAKLEWISKHFTTKWAVEEKQAYDRWLELKPKE